ncbi:hypothetical protein [Holzapfeliella sp. JNUCC72]
MLIVICSAFFIIPNIDLPVQYNFTRQTIFKYLLMIACINTVIYSVVMLLVKLLISGSLVIATKTIPDTPLDYFMTFMILLCASLFSLIYVFSQHYLSKTSRLKRSLSYTLLVLLAMIGLPIIYLFPFSPMIIIASYTLIATLEIAVVYYFVTHAELTSPVMHRAWFGK